MSEHYKLFCTQNGCYRNTSFNRDESLKTLKEWRDYLIELHSLDTDKRNLINLTLFDLCNYYEWEIHNSNGEFVDLHKLKYNQERNTNEQSIIKDSTRVA